MQETTKLRIPKSPSDYQFPSTTDLLTELRAIHAEQSALRRLFDEFARVFLNTKFPHGRPTDRWGRR